MKNKNQILSEVSCIFLETKYPHDWCDMHEAQQIQFVYMNKKDIFSELCAVDVISSIEEIAENVSNLC